MKRSILLCAALVLVFCICGCAAAGEPAQPVKISLVETDGCIVHANGQWVSTGSDAVFLLELEEGLSLAATDYPGGYTIRTVDGCLELRLKDVRYPARVNLVLTSRYSTVTYDPNGGTGEAVTETYDLSIHSRPNTGIGTDLFHRAGYTLVSWNTKPDGSGQRIGLGSRVDGVRSARLYAQWEKWTDPSEFQYQVLPDGEVRISEYLGSRESVVVPAEIEGKPVTQIGSGAFTDAPMRALVLPPTIKGMEAGAVTNCPIEQILLFDNIEDICDACFRGCDQLQTLYINAMEAPYGYAYRKESCYADKVDLLIAAQGTPKLVFYGGCSAWYNLDGKMADEVFGDAYTVINMGLNGTVNSAAQMQILEHYLEDGDIFLHTLEIASKRQLMVITEMGEYDDKLWCGLEYNYDLFSLVDLRTVPGVFDSFRSYLSMKVKETSYQQCYMDSNWQIYMDEYGCVPFHRGETGNVLADRVCLDPNYPTEEGWHRLEECYGRYRELGVTVCVSYACVNMDEVPENQRENVAVMDALVKDRVARMDGPAVISDLEDYLYTHSDFYDTNYHLLTAKVRDNTAAWLRDLLAYLENDH